MPGDDWVEWAEILKGVAQDWKNIVAKIGRRNKWKGRILHRSHSMYVGYPTYVHWKIMIREDTPGESDAVIQELYDEMLAYKIVEKSYQSGDSAIVQMMEDSTMSLVGVEEGPAQAAYFNAWWLATKGKHSFQSMGPIFREIKEVPKVPEVPGCDICGEPMTFRLRTPNRVSSFKAPEPAPVEARTRGDPFRQLELV